MSTWVRLVWDFKNNRLITENGEVVYGVQGVDYQINLGEMSNTTILIKGISVGEREEKPSRDDCYQMGLHAGRLEVTAEHLEAMARIEELEVQLEEAKVQSVVASNPGIDPVAVLESIRETARLKTGFNGGVACDVREGPCACGAWH